MANLVTAGTLLRCDKGSATSPLQLAGHAVNAGGQAVAAVQDSQGQVNVRPFGTCMSPANPAFSQSAGNGPCNPIIITPWINGSASVLVAGHAVVTTASRCQCQWGGQVTAAAPGQPSVTAG